MSATQSLPFSQQFQIEFIKELGQGCSGSVKQAKLPEGNLIAVKDFTKQPRLFYKELSVIKNLQDCNHIIQYIPNSHCEQNMKIATKLYSRGDLFDLCSNDSIHVSEAQVRKVAVQLIEALSHMHKKGYAHLDVKLENIYIEDSGDVVLADFGLTESILNKTSKQNSPYFSSQEQSNNSQKQEAFEEEEEEEEEKLLNRWVGTKNYAAPEVKQRQLFYGTKADVFSLGATLFALLTKCEPLMDNLFMNENKFWNQIKRHMNVEPSDEFKDLIKQMCNPDPELRPTLREVLSHEWFNGPIDSL